MTDLVPTWLTALAWVVVPSLLTLLLWRWPRWRLRRALRRPLSAEQHIMLRRGLPIYDRLTGEEQGKLAKLVQQFLFEKRFVGCAGLDVTEDMRLTIAAQACLLVLHQPTRVYPVLHTILVYPSAFLVPRRQVDGAGVVHAEQQTLLGESWSDGRVVLSWDDVVAGTRDWGRRHNVVLHEFAHQLDSESGQTNGAPYLGHPDSYRRWAEVLSRHYAGLRIDALNGSPSLLDHYGATSPAEFFAVATEAFFLAPYELAGHYPELFAEFARYFRTDPRQWTEAPAPELPEDLQFAPAWYGWR